MSVMKGVNLVEGNCYTYPNTSDNSISRGTLVSIDTKSWKYPVAKVVDDSGEIQEVSLLHLNPDCEDMPKKYRQVLDYVQKKQNKQILEFSAESKVFLQKYGRPILLEKYPEKMVVRVMTKLGTTLFSANSFEDEIFSEDELPKDIFGRVKMMK